MYAPIDIDEMRGRLLTLEAAEQRLAPTENLHEYEFDTDGSNVIDFSFPNNWNDGLKSRDDTYVTEATVNLDGQERPLTKSAALDAASAIGLQKAYLYTTPGELIGPHLNYHYVHGANGKKTMKMLAGDGGVVGLTRGTIKPFSNLRLVEAAVEGLSEHYETNEILVDYKFHHDVDLTNLRLILPTHTREIGSARAQAANDPWSVGLEITNSLTGAKPLELSGYLFAWWCTNGCTMTHSTSGKYRRKPTQPVEDAYDWARSVVDDVCRHLEHEFDRIEGLTQIQLEGELGNTLDNIFDNFNVPDNLRDDVIANLVESDDLTAYGLLNSLTAVANDADVSNSAVNALLRAGGEFVHAISDDRCANCGKF